MKINIKNKVIKTFCEGVITGVIVLGAISLAVYNLDDGANETNYTQQMNYSKGEDYVKMINDGHNAGVDCLNMLTDFAKDSVCGTANGVSENQKRICTNVGKYVEKLKYINFDEVQAYCDATGKDYDEIVFLYNQSVRALKYSAGMLDKMSNEAITVSDCITLQTMATMCSKTNINDLTDGEKSQLDEYDKEFNVEYK